MAQIEREHRRHPDHPADNRTPFRRDRDRLLYSNFFRRLAGVTQVVHAAEGHVFHNRLTHSIKVAQTGRSLVEHLIQKTKPETIDALGGLDADVVETACLAHDLGHPPFGHVAEDALDNCARRSDAPDGFEGNPQSFRIVTRVAIRDHEHPGLNLTSASLNAILKYPWQRATSGRKQRKWGFYYSDETDFHFARSRNKGSEKRSIEAEIMDWADDVAYSLHDVDDFYRAGLVPLDIILTGGAEADRFLSAMEKDKIIRSADNGAKFFKLLQDVVVQKDILVPFHGSTAQYQALRRLESFLIRRFLGIDEPEALKLTDSGKNPGLQIASTLREEVDVLKGLMRFYVYGAQSLVAQQYGQRKLIGTLFEILFEATKKKSRHSGVLPPPYDEQAKRINDADSGDDTEQVRLAMDIIASMTEQQAIAFHHRLTGTAPGYLSDRIFGG